MSSLVIDGRRIDDGSECYVIAEIGNNHQGSVEKAREMIRQARECGADAVKFQKRDNRGLYTRALYEGAYHSENSFGDTYGAHREALEFDREQYIELRDYAREVGITFFSTAFDRRSADFLAALDMPAYKIASGDLTNTPLLRHVARLGKPMILSTGGGLLEDVQRAYDTVRPLNPQICILQCTAAYPVEPEDMHLSVIPTFREAFPDAVIGLSDHQNGIAMATVAYALGARVIEKHFTLNRAWKGTDHAFSLEPVGLKKMIRDLHRARAALGNPQKQRLPSEEKPLFKMAKKIVAGRDLPAGHRLTEDDLAFKSPGDGLPPFETDRVVGRVLTRALSEDEPLSFEDLAGD
jgi:sialic acid synthase